MRYQKKGGPFWIAAVGAVGAAYAGYLLNACFQPRTDIYDFMDRFRRVTENLTANYWDENSVKAILISLLVYMAAVLLHMTDRKKYMPGIRYRSLCGSEADIEKVRRSG